MEKTQYEITCNCFLSRFLGLHLEGTSKKKWSHTKICEVLRDLHLLEILDVSKRNLEYEEAIATGEILLVKDHYGKVKPYYNPEQLNMKKNNENVLKGINAIDLEELLWFEKMKYEQVVQSFFQSKFHSLQEYAHAYYEILKGQQRLEELQSQLQTLKEQENNCPSLPKPITFTKKRGNRRKVPYNRKEGKSIYEKY